jgi:hypothetical protein
MGFFDRLMGKGDSAGKSSSRPKSVSPHSTQFAHSHTGPQSTTSAQSQHSLRKDLLKVVLRETLMRNGIPANWISADLLRATSPKREPGVHVRFLLRQWDPRLMLYGVAFEQNFYKRLVAMDPQAASWLMGISWQFAMEDLSQCPPLPHPGSWTSQEEAALSAAGVAAAAAAATAAAGPAGDVIAGPVVIPKGQDEVRADLEKLLAVRDQDMKKHSDDGGFQATQPIQL